MSMTRKKSLCTRIKRNRTKCLRFKGCKQASGPKRKFCRKRKNTKKNITRSMR